MSSERSPPTLDLAFASAPLLAAGVAAVHAGAVAAVLASGLPLPARAAGGAALAAFGLWWVAERGFGLGPAAVRRLVWYPDDECVLLFGNGSARDGRVVFGTLLGAGLATLRVRTGRRLRTLVVTRGAAGSEAFRLLSVRLALARPGGVRNGAFGRLRRYLRRRSHG